MDKICKFCWKDCSLEKSLNSHIWKCPSNPESISYLKDVNCEFCWKICKSINSLKQHQVRCLKNPNFIMSDKLKNSYSHLKKWKLENSSLLKMKETKRMNRNKKNWEIIIKSKICIKCWKEFSYEEREFINKHSKFCSRSCANSRVHSKKTLNKISQSINDYNILNWRKRYKIIKKTTCLYCKKEFEYSSFWNYERKCCSFVCSWNLTTHKPLSSCSKMRLKYIRKIKYILGEAKWWTTRKWQTSYPEKFWEDVLKNNNIEFGREIKVWTFFIDFTFPWLNIALEIDWSQHLHPDRIEHDKRKDKYLKENWWDVYRIAWKSINNENWKKYMKEKIDLFLEYYKSKLV